MLNGDYDYLLKYLVVGNYGVGKTSIIKSACCFYNDDEEPKSKITTIGVDFKIKSFFIDGFRVKTNIWDTAGQERFKNISTSYYKNASGVVLVYDITDLESFNKIGDWLVEVTNNSPKDIYLVLLGNKSDLADERQVSYDQGKVRSMLI